MRKIKTDVVKGINSVNWDLRYTSTSPIKLKTVKPGVIQMQMLVL